MFFTPTFTKQIFQKKSRLGWRIQVYAGIVLQLTQSLIIRMLTFSWWSTRAPLSIKSAQELACLVMAAPTRAVCPFCRRKKTRVLCVSTKIMGLLSCSKYQLMGSKGFRAGPPQIWFVSSHQAVISFTQEGSEHVCTAALLEGSLKATRLFSYKNNTLQY